MITSLSQKLQLLSLSIACIAFYSLTPAFAQQPITITGNKVTTISITSNEKADFFVKDCALTHPLNSKKQDTNNKPKLGVLLEGNDEGITILKTFPNSAAEEAGLQEGDKILRLDGQSTETIKALVDLIQAHEVGDKITVEYSREGKVYKRVVSLKKVSENHYLNRRSIYRGQRYQVENLTENACEQLDKIYGKPFLGVYLNASHLEDGTGAKLTSIIDGTGADDAQLKAADKIIKMNQKEIHSTKEAIAFIKSKKPGDKIRIKLLRDNKLMTIRATLGSWADSPTMQWKTTILEENCERKNTETAPKTTAKKAPKQALKKSSVSLEAYPNPSTDFVQVNYKGEKAPLMLKVVNLEGKEMFVQQIQKFDGLYNKQLDVSNYPAGVYFLHIKQGEQLTTQKIVVE